MIENAPARDWNEPSTDGHPDAPSSDAVGPTTADDEMRIYPSQALKLRIGAGIVIFALPFVMVAGSWAHDGRAWRPSISAYYHSYMQGVFVLALFALAVLLQSYPVGQRDRWIPAVGYFAAGTVAVVPTAAEGQSRWSTDSVIHGVASVLLFGCLTALVARVLVLPDSADSPISRGRQFLYRMCVIVMVAAMLASLVLLVLQLAGQPAKGNILFWLEVAALWAFAAAWLAKNASLLKAEEAVIARTKRWARKVPAVLRSSKNAAAVVGTRTFPRHEKSLEVNKAAVQDSLAAVEFSRVLPDSIGR